MAAQEAAEKNQDLSIYENIIPVLKYWADDMKTLTTPSSPITEFNEELRVQAGKMGNTLYFYNAVGLSGVQVGYLKRIFISRAGGDKFIAFVNPEILKFSDEKNTALEGCLSFPDTFSAIERSKEITIRYQTLDGEEKQHDVSGLMAVCCQHEIEHLDGKTFLEKMSITKRQIVLQKLERSIRTGRISKDIEVLEYMQNLSKSLSKKVEEELDKQEEN